MRLNFGSDFLAGLFIIRVPERHGLHQIIAQTISFQICPECTGCDGESVRCRQIEDIADIRKVGIFAAYQLIHVLAQGRIKDGEVTLGKHPFPGEFLLNGIVDVFEDFEKPYIFSGRQGI